MTLLRSWWFRIPAALIVLIVVASLGWWFFVREDAELADAAPEVPKDLVSPTVVLGQGTTRFRIVAERSKASYFAGETLARVALPSTAQGITEEIAGEFFLTASGLDPSQTSRFAVQLKNLKSGEAQRDRRVQETLATSRFPETTFIVTRVDGFPELVADEDRTFALVGRLSLHGVEKEVTWEVKARREGNVMTALATVTFRYDAFGITPPDIAGFVSVEDEVTLQVEVVATAE